MARLFALYLTLTLTVLIFAAPVPDDGLKTRYYPIKSGTKWTYRTGGKTFVVKIESVETKNGATVINIVTEEANGISNSYEKLLLSEKGVFRISSLGEKVEPPMCLLKLPAKPGMEWEADAGGLVVKETHKLFGPEEIEVPAGKYKAIRVESKVIYANLDEPLRYTDWYVPGVGCIKSVRGESVTELEAFTPSKK
jgi:hypothetical protein